MDTTQQPAAPVAAATPGIFGTKIPSNVAFVVGILLFFLPFADIKCGNTKLATQTGLGFVMGNEWKESISKSDNMFGNTENKSSGMDNSKDKKEGQIYALVAIGLAVLGLLLSFADAKLGGTAGILTGILSAGALIGLMVDIKNYISKQSTTSANNNSDNFHLNMSDIKMTVDFTPWFYVAVIAFLAAAFFSYRRMTVAGKINDGKFNLM